MMPILNKIVKDIPEAMSIYINQIVYDKKSRGERVIHIPWARRFLISRALKFLIQIGTQVIIIRQVWAMEICVKKFPKCIKNIM